MGFKLLVIAILTKIVVGRIRLDINLDENQEVQVNYTGNETQVVTDEDISSFNIGSGNLLAALNHTMGKQPNNVYLRSPTPWGDLYNTNNWKQVTRVLKVKSAKVKTLERHPVEVSKQIAQNPSTHSIKVTTGMSRTLENTLTTSWTKEGESTLSQDVEYEVNVGIANVGGKTGFSFTSIFGVSEEKAKAETLSTYNSVEVELKPGEAVTAVMMALAGNLEIEVVYEAHLTGILALNYYPTYKEHHFHGVEIEQIYPYEGIKRKVITTETIRINYYAEAQLQVNDEKLKTNKKKTVNKEKKQSKKKLKRKKNENSEEVQLPNNDKKLKMKKKKIVGKAQMHGKDKKMKRMKKIEQT